MKEEDESRLLTPEEQDAIQFKINAGWTTNTPDTWCKAQLAKDTLHEKETMPKVLNRRTDKIPSDAVYVGRPSKWGNPYQIGVSGTRGEVIQLYREDLEDAVSDNPHYLDKLKGKDLVCWCAPLPCHADVLLELANKEEVLHA